MLHEPMSSAKRPSSARSAFRLRTLKLSPFTAAGPDADPAGVDRAVGVTHDAGVGHAADTPAKSQLAL
ncbi:MAG: hypothetical protein SF069_01100 [Phycisphaerae bacterium]|nr:hypothetical protein [Phycisphaerae bacterium]